MRKKLFRGCLLLLVAFGLVSLVSCTSASSSHYSDFYNVGAGNITLTGAQFAQYTLFRFDTSAAACTLNFPNAADIVNAISSPYAGEVIIMAVSADGSNQVNVVGGTGVVVKTSAGTIQPNSTATLYCVLDNVTPGSEAVFIY